MANEVGGGNESLIGKGTKVTGKLVFTAKARIEGEVEGEITGEEIILSETAVVNARITAQKPDYRRHRHRRYHGAPARRIASHGPRPWHAQNPQPDSA